MLSLKLPVIYGLNKSSEACPDNFAPSIFLGGCNFCCDYCMNCSLVNNLENLNKINIENIKDFVLSEKCRWVHISGGEITIQNTEEVINLIKLIKSWGCMVSISTNGFEYERLQRILGFIDHVTMDIKTGAAKYDTIVCGYSGAINNIKKSLQLLQAKSNIEKTFSYEIRTTLYRPLVGESEIIEIGELVGNSAKWVLQPFRKTKSMLSKIAYEVEEYTEVETNNLLMLSRNYNNNVLLQFV